MALLLSVLHKIRYTIFEIPYWTHSGIVFDKFREEYNLKNIGAMVSETLTA